MMRAVVMRSEQDLGILSVDDLRAELSRALDVTAKHLAYLATVWRELERRGEDLSHLRSGLWAYMSAIASGKLLPEMVVRYAGHAMLLRRLAGLGLEDQRTVLQHDNVVIVIRRDGGWVEESKPLASLTAPEINQVIGRTIRAPVEQRRVALARAKAREVGGVTKADKITARAQDAHRRKEERLIQVGVPLDEDEQSALAAHALRGGISRARLVRAALQAAGLLNDPS